MSDVSLVVGFVDQPTDGVLDYCARLAQALGPRGFSVEVSSRRRDGTWDPRPPWSDRGGTCIVQFTNLAWSRRGFPVRLLPVLRRIRRAERRLIVVIHEPTGFPGSGPIAALRRRVQHAVMRRALVWSSGAVVAVEPELIEWLSALPPDERGKLIHIPVGSNVSCVDVRDQQEDADRFTVSVFGVTERSGWEAPFIARVIAGASSSTEIRLQVFGRGALDAEQVLTEGLTGTGVELRCEGLLPPCDVADRLDASDALLFIRGASTRRGTMIAAISAGVPVVAVRGEETGPLVERSGVILVDQDDVSEASSALVRLSEDPELREELRARNLAVTREAFSWDAIADRFVELLS